jgi:hypothetical protein
MSNRLSIRTEYGAWPIWDIDDFGYIDPNQLPLEPETISQLLAWQAKLDDTFDQECPSNSGFSSDEDREAWRLEGIRLWQKIKKELEPPYKIYYYLYCKNKKHFLSNLGELEEVLN